MDGPAPVRAGGAADGSGDWVLEMLMPASSPPRTTLPPLKKHVRCVFLSFVQAGVAQRLGSLGLWSGRLDASRGLQRAQP